MAKNKNIRYITADISALVVFLVALIVIIGWLTDMSSLKALYVTHIPMKANTALNFLFLALSLLLINPSRISKVNILISRILVCVVIIISLLTIIEYFTGLNFGIDLFAVSDSTKFPGRMALNTAVSFILAGISMLLLSKERNNKNDFIRVLLLFMGFICLLSIVGYLFKVEGYSSFFIFNSMALHTAILFLVFFAGMIMILKREYQPLKKLEYQTIAGFGVALVTIILIGVIAVKNSSRVVEANKITNKTFHVIHNIEEILSLSKDVEAGVRGFALTNDSIFLSPYLNSKYKIQKVVLELKGDLLNNPVQISNLDSLEILLSECFTYFNELIYTRQNKGLSEASKLVANARGKNITDRIRNVTNNMSMIETALLERRSDYETETAGKTLIILLLFTFLPFGLLVFIYIILRKNIIEHYQNEESIRNRTIELEQRYKILFNEMPDGFGLHEMIFDKDGKPVDYRFLDINPAFEALTGLKRKNVIGKRILEVVPNLEKYWIEKYGDVVLNNKTARFENYSQGLKKFYEVSASPFSTNQFVVIFIDITERKKAEETIKAQLKEKEVLLRELYHRTKNNMQVISSFIGLKSESIKDDYVRIILADMKNRIQTIALVHQKLYQSKNLSKVDLKEYITDLSQLLLPSYFRDHQIEIILNLESIDVLIDTAIPCGLIINELVSNSIKYAFPDYKKGEIRISLKKKENDIIELAISDNGVGLPPNFDYENTDTLGLQLFKTIAEDQLQGEVSLRTDKGVSTVICFKDIHYEARV